MLNYAGGTPVTAYNLTRSLRFRSSATAWLGRTPATTTNQQIWTWSGWVKRGVLLSGGFQTLFNASVDASNFTELRFTDTSNGVFEFTYVVGGADTARLTTTQVFRDPSAYYHVIFVADTTQATAANRLKLYVNGAQVTAFSTATYPSLNANLFVNSANTHGIGITRAVGRYYDGYMTEVNFIDGQALTPSSFGSTNALTGVWQPARYTGTYGTNGFYLPFTDNSALTTSSNVGLGKDFSGNGNYWTTNNISITAGVTYDSMTDVPTLTSATASNFAVLNPINLPSGVSVLDGNLKWSGGGVYSLTRATMAIPLTGKYYWEITPTTAPASGTSSMYTGVTSTTSPNTNYLEQDSPSCGYLATSGNIAFTGGSAAYGATYTTNDVIGVAVDMDNGAIYFAKNNTWQNSGVPTSGASKTGAARTNLAGASLQPSLAVNTSFSVTAVANFGQRPFTYTPPTGFVALNTFNLPTSTIVKGNTVMDATLYTGTGASLSVTNTASFKPDLVWLKSRSNATDNELTDSVRGVTKSLISNSSAAEATDTQGLTAFNSNGFTLGTDANYNGSGRTFVGWQWQAGQGSSSSNTNGSITSTVSVNASAGFSVVTYTGTGANATVGHGLGVAPSLVIAKRRVTGGFNWLAWHSAFTGLQFIKLNLTDAYAGSATVWNSTVPSSSVFSLGSDTTVNPSAESCVAYCWTPIAGYSAFGSYTGNGSTDGTFVYTGFRPRWVLIKRIDTSGFPWWLLDTARNTYNVADIGLIANSSDSESSAGFPYSTLDFLSNGFKLKATAGGVNASGGTYIYMAFAENPFKNSLAR